MLLAKNTENALIIAAFYNIDPGR